MGYNYTFRLTAGKVTRDLSYRYLLDLFEMKDEIVHGAKMSAGGTPQALSLKTAIETVHPGVKVEVWHGGSRWGAN